MPELKSFHRPESLKEALELLREHGERARPLAGGTSLVFNPGIKVEALVDLGRIGLDTIGDADGALTLGAMVKASVLRRHLDGRAPTALSEAADWLYSRVVQNHVTVGGNCVMVYGWSDLPLATWCLGARFSLQGPAGARELDADEFYAKHPTKALAADELLVSVSVPTAKAREGSAYRKTGRDKTDEAVAAVAARVALDEAGAIASASIVVGAVRPLPQKLGDAAASLVGKTPDATAFVAAGGAVAKAINVTDNYLASAEYRRELVSALVEETLAAAAERASQGGGQ